MIFLVVFMVLHGGWRNRCKQRERARAAVAKPVDSSKALEAVTNWQADIRVLVNAFLGSVRRVSWFAFYFREFSAFSSWEECRLIHRAVVAS